MSYHPSQLGFMYNSRTLLRMVDEGREIGFPLGDAQRLIKRSAEHQGGREAGGGVASELSSRAAVRRVPCTSASSKLRTSQ